jgi:hypothetical protein
MKTLREITYIILDRGNEDKKLYDEILDIMDHLSEKYIPRELFQKFPKVCDLKQKLKNELIDQGYFEY